MKQGYRFPTTWITLTKRDRWRAGLGAVKAFDRDLSGLELPYTLDKDVADNR
jgi:hypothetical protein